MLYENSPVPYFLMDDQGSIHDTNKATWRFFGGTKQECELINFFERIEHSGAHSNVATILRSKVERGLPISNVEMSIQALEGSSRWVLVSIYSLARTTTLPFRHLVTLIDITKEKEHEQVKSDFLLLASHQLRTPMTTIKWYTDYLLNTPSIEMNGIVREYLSEIEHGNERMIELVNTLLTVSRLEMGTLSPEYTPVHVQEIMRDIFKELTPDAKKRSIDIRLVTNGDDKLVTDRSMLRIVLHNLLTNAIKYSQLGGTVLVTSEFTASGCTIAVSDSGCGIPLAEQDKIFSKMYRASNAKKVSASGTGLGLHLTRSFMAKLGGSIDFTSVEGQGSTFTLQLPRVAPEA
jgi:PAS domain S-box-containing protein